MSGLPPQEVTVRVSTEISTRGIKVRSKRLATMFHTGDSERHRNLQVIFYTVHNKEDKTVRLLEHTK